MTLKLSTEYFNPNKKNYTAGYFPCLDRNHYIKSNTFFILKRKKYVRMSATQLINSGEKKKEFLLSLAKDIKNGDIESANIKLETLG